jgi:hypothetical protein
MLTRVDEDFRSEASRFALRFTCEVCAHFDPERDRCSHEYPNAPHRLVDAERVSVLSFCKLFELA